MTSQSVRIVGQPVQDFNLLSANQVSAAARVLLIVASTME